MYPSQNQPMPAYRGATQAGLDGRTTVMRPSGRDLNAASVQRPSLQENPSTSCPPSNMGWAAAALLFFWPLAFASFSNAGSVATLWLSGDRVGAQHPPPRDQRSVARHHLPDLARPAPGSAPRAGVVRDTDLPSLSAPRALTAVGCALLVLGLILFVYSMTSPVTLLVVAGQGSAGGRASGGRHDVLPLSSQ